MHCFVSSFILSVHIPGKAPKECVDSNHYYYKFLSNLNQLHPIFRRCIPLGFGIVLFANWNKYRGKHPKRVHPKFPSIEQWKKTFCSVVINLKVQYYHSLKFLMINNETNFLEEMKEHITSYFGILNSND